MGTLRTDNNRRPSMEGLLYDLYDRFHSRHLSFESSESWTDTSHYSDNSGRINNSRRDKYYSRETLKQLNPCELRMIVESLQRENNEMSQKLVRQLKRRDHQLSRNQAKCNIVTAVLQALSPKRSVDTRLQFSLDPPTTESGYDQWLNAMKAVARLPDGIPHHFRRKLWLTLAQHHLESTGVEWEEIRKSAFNDRMNPDDDKLGMQIIKDLHRTGWSGLSGEQERVLLKRVLLAYARYNKAIGYCQGFNVIAALVLEVTEYKEENALKVMIFLIEQVLPSGYFDQTLRALSVDMAVLRDLMHQRLPRLAAHLEYLQQSSESEYEPPLTNVFSMQWLLTLFATCLPKSCVFRVWDSLMLEGSEILLRSALAIWARIGRRASRSMTADEFYGLMGPLCQELLRMGSGESNDLMQVIYSMADFPYPGLDALRERYTWNIQPFSSTFKLLRQQVASILNSDSEDSSDSEKQGQCLPGFVPGGEKICSSSRAGSSTDLGNLQKQYRLMKQRQKQAAVILQNAYEKGQHSLAPKSMRMNGTSHQRHINGEMFNHLYVGDTPPRAVFGTMNGTIPVTSKAIQPSGISRSDDKNPGVSRTGSRSRQRSANFRLGSASSSQSTATPDLTMTMRGSVATIVGSWSSGNSTPRRGMTGALTKTVTIPAHRLTGSSRFLYGTTAREANDFSSLRKCRSLDLAEWSRTVLEISELEHYGNNWEKRHSRFRSGSCVDLTGVWDEIMEFKKMKRTLTNAKYSRTVSDFSEAGDKTPKNSVINENFCPPSTLNNRIHHESLSLSETENLLYSPTALTGETSFAERKASLKSRKESAGILNKSKAILNRFHSEEEEFDVPVFNPFPTRHQSTLIEREKKLGLYA